MGHPRQDDRLCSQVAAALDVVVLAPRYRLAPRHRFPAALDDCREAFDWLVANAGSLGIDPARIAIGGDSAGGGLAACLVQSLCDERPGTVAAQWLFQPMLDDRTGADGRNDDPPEYFWKAADNRFGWGAYLGVAPGSPAVPRYAVAARYEGAAALPPAWIGIGTEDLFLEECRAYARRLQESGTPVELVCAPDAPHGFLGWAPDAAVSQRFQRAAFDWLGRAICK
jgi:acetyl esterase/lipase